MNNFRFSLPTSIYFGKDSVDNLSHEVKKYGNKVLLTYGGGSIKRSGIYDRVMAILREENIEVFELGGIDPNPRIETVRQGVKICKENNIDLILAVGGGSTIDCSKAIGAGYYYDGDPWDFYIKKARIKKSLPIGTILTMAATGSEMNGGTVISNIEENKKLATGHGSLRPKFSILDPTYTFSLPKYHTASGIADIMSHTFENYFTVDRSAYIQDRFAEGILKTCIKYGPIAIAEPNNYEARANIMWAAPHAINGLIGSGKDSIWSLHDIEHELSAYYDIAHGVGLAILTPHWMDYVLDDERLDRFVDYGVNVWNIDRNKDPYEIARESIVKTKEFFKSLGIPMSLSEMGIGDEKLEIMARAAIENNGGKIGSFKPLDYEDVLGILKRAL